MTIEINVLSGSSTIGGNKILAQFDGRNVLFDFGYDYTFDNLYFDLYTKVRPNRGIHDMLELGMLPKYQIYRDDSITMDCASDYSRFPRMKIDALFISHAHMDHMGMAGFLDPGVPFVATPMTLAMMKAIKDTSPSSGIGTEVTQINPRQSIDDYLIKSPKESSPVGRRLVSTSKCESLEAFLSQSPKKKKEIVRESCQLPESIGFETVNFDVDHSIYGASAFGVKTEEGWVVYTGDLRTHGIEGEKTLAFADGANKLRPRVLIIEGTRLSRDEEGDNTTEEAVEKNCLEACNGVKGLIIADFGPRNFERLEAFARIALKVGRRLVVTVKDAYFLDSMKSADGKDRLAAINILDEHKDSSSTWSSIVSEMYGSSMVTPEQVRERPDDFIICFSNYDMPHLLDIKPKGGMYLYSGSGSFDEEQDHDFERLDNWLKKFNMKKVGFELEGKISYRGRQIMVPSFTPGFHASGHAPKEVLKDIIERIRPEYLIPVHTQNPKYYVENISSVPVENILLPEDGRSIKIG